MPEQTKQQEDQAAERLSRLNQKIVEMIQKGFVEYKDKQTGNIQTLTFDTVVSEGCDSNSFITALFGFFKIHHCDNGKHVTSSELMNTRGFLMYEIQKLIVSYIEDGILDHEELPEPEVE